MGDVDVCLVVDSLSGGGVSQTPACLGNNGVGVEVLSVSSCKDVNGVA